MNDTLRDASDNLIATGASPGRTSGCALARRPDHDLAHLVTDAGLMAIVHGDVDTACRRCVRVWKSEQHLEREWGLAVSGILSAHELDERAALLLLADEASP